MLPPTGLLYGKDIISPDDYNINLRVRPSQFINNRIYISNISNFIISSIYDTSNLEDRHLFTLEYILTELVINAVRYGLPEEEVEISVLKDQENNKIFFCIKNSIDQEVFQKFSGFLSILFNSDPETLFLHRINNLSARIHENIDNAGIGLISLLNDYNLPLCYYIDQKSTEKFLITTKFVWDLQIHE